MNWKDIEVKWAAMARRVRSDLPQEEDDMVMTRAPETPALRDEPAEMRVPTPLDRPAA